MHSLIDWIAAHLTLVTIVVVGLAVGYGRLMWQLWPWRRR